MRVLIDMDGVIADFQNHFCYWKGWPYPRPWPKGEYHLAKVFGKTETEIWEGITEEFWLTMPRTAEAEELIRWVGSIFGWKNLCLVSVGPYTGNYKHIGYSGKVGWIQRNFPGFMKSFMLGPRRELLADGDTILIDDFEENVAKFGGNGVLFPRDWNSRTERWEVIYREMLAIKEKS